MPERPVAIEGGGGRAVPERGVPTWGGGGRVVWDDRAAASGNPSSAATHTVGSGQ
ncbi:hypothetical protein ACFZDI_33175 [Streptomyces sp. NPDC007907]|uniref:Uncharacterized protein n=1 Tax=Streptomyces indiaensis TaxID=284033 RepID=A0ABN3DZ24_9ACTN